MKRGLVLTVLTGIILVIIKYYIADYSIEYKIDNYEIKTNYKDERIYYEIKGDNNIYNFEIYTKRKLSKKKIEEIKEIKDETINCIYPKINDIETYPLCYENGVYKDYNLIESELLQEYKKEIINVEKSDKDFIYYNNLENNEYVALWNYKGFIVMNGSSYKNVELFKKDKYDNTQSYLMNDTLYTANYDENHEYTKLISLNLKNLKKSEIEIGYHIDYDSYIVGHIKKKLYIFDNKHSKLYEIDLKKKETKIISSNELGYKKYNGKEFVKCSKSEYKVDKIKYNFDETNHIYETNQGIFKTIKDNENLKQLINTEEIIKIKDYKERLYFSNKDNFYIYTPSKGNVSIFYNFELSFNNNNTIFVYIDN